MAWPIPSGVVVGLVTTIVPDGQALVYPSLTRSETGNRGKCRVVSTAMMFEELSWHGLVRLSRHWRRTCESVIYTYDYDSPDRLCQTVDCIGMRTNMTYDTGPLANEADEPVVIETKSEKTAEERP